MRTPPLPKRSRWPELCGHAKALNDEIVKAGVATSESLGNITQEDVERLVDELETTLELAVGELEVLLAFMDRVRVLALHAVDAQALVMLAVTPVLVATVTGSCLWLFIRWGELTFLRLLCDALLALAATLVAGGSGMAALACRCLAPEMLKKVSQAVEALAHPAKCDASSNFDSVCRLAYSLAVAYEVPQSRQQFCKLPWVTAGVLLAVELLVAVCSGSVFAFAAVLLVCAGQALATGLAAMALAPRGHFLDCPPDADVPECAVACMGRSPMFAAAAAALVSGLFPLLEARLGLDSLNERAAERLDSLRVVIQELHLTRRSLIQAARNTLDHVKGWSLSGSVGGLATGVTSSVTSGVESMSSGVSCIALGASSLLFG